MKNYNIDIHAHCTLKPYSHNYPGDSLSIWATFDNGGYIQSTHMLKLIDYFGPDTLRGTQTSFEQAARGQVKILGISLFTYESGWMGEGLTMQEKSLISNLTGISMQKLAFIQNSRLDHQIYTDITDEFIYLGKEVQKTHHAGGVEWQVKFLTRDILQQIHNGTINPGNDNIIYVFVSIEGLQSLGIESMKRSDHKFPLRDDKANAVKARINEIKNTWRSIPQYITFCHHFGNGLAGHASSIPTIMRNIMNINQQSFLDNGLTPKAKEIIFELMCDDRRQILVDIKHFSARARKEYYAYIEELKLQKPAMNFPILCSHTGFVNNVTTLDELALSNDNGASIKNEWLHTWSINMCKEDLQHIQASGGLIGLQIDLKRLIGKKYEKELKKPKDAESRLRLSCEVVWANIFTAVGLLNNKAAWDLLCIGSDYDGIVTYLPEVKTLAEYPTLKTKMKQVLDNGQFVAIDQVDVDGRKLDSATRNALMFGYSSEEILDKVFTTNAVAFWKDHFVDQVLPSGQLIPELT